MICFLLCALLTAIAHGLIMLV